MGQDYSCYDFLFYDIFCFGARSSAWQEVSQDMTAETKDFYRAGIIKFGAGDEKSQFFDFCFYFVFLIFVLCFVFMLLFHFCAPYSA